MHPSTIRRRSRLSPGFAPQAAVATSGPADHSVAEMRWFPVREPVSGNRYTVLRVKTRSGLIGWGECASAPQRDAKDLEKEWIGRPATLYAAIDRSSLLAGALDMALLDILGKACRTPVYRVLGGPTRHKVRAFTGSNVAGFSAAGIVAPKPASRNQGKAYENQVQALLKELPEDRDFVLSAHGSLTPGDAASVARAIESSHPLWFDEPCPASNLESVRKISGETVTPLGFGRGVRDPGVFLALLREGLVDVVGRISRSGELQARAKSRYWQRRIMSRSLQTTRADRSLPRRHYTWPPAFRISSSNVCRCRTILRTAKCALLSRPPAWRPRATDSCSFRPVRVSESM